MVQDVQIRYASFVQIRYASFWFFKVSFNHKERQANDLFSHHAIQSIYRLVIYTLQSIWNYNLLVEHDISFYCFLKHFLLSYSANLI